MFNLPRRETEIRVPVEDVRVVLVMKPLSDQQFYAVNETARIETVPGTDQVTVRYRFSGVPHLFNDRLLRAEHPTRADVEGMLAHAEADAAGSPSELLRAAAAARAGSLRARLDLWAEEERLAGSPITIGGEPFDRRKQHHVDSVPQPWKPTALAELLRYANGLTETERGNSLSPDGASSTAETVPPA